MGCTDLVQENSCLYWAPDIPWPYSQGLQFFRAGLHHGPWNHTMEHGLLLWFDLMIQHPRSNFLRNQFTKPLSPSLGVNWLWTKSACACYFNTCPKRAALKKKSSLTILFSSLPYKTFHSKISITSFPCHGPLPFFLLEPTLKPTFHSIRKLSTYIAYMWDLEWVHISEPPLATLKCLLKFNPTSAQNQPCVFPQPPHFSPKSGLHSALETFKWIEVCSKYEIRRYS